MAMRIHTKKSVLKPLWLKPDLPLVARRISATTPRCSTFSVATSFKYLVGMIGHYPEILQLRWDDAILKYWGRIGEIAALGGSWSQGVYLHRAIAFPALTYILQVSPFSVNVGSNFQSRVLAKVLRLPMNAVPSRIFVAMQGWGFHEVWPDFSAWSLASASRAAVKSKYLSERFESVSNLFIRGTRRCVDPVKV